MGEYSEPGNNLEIPKYQSGIEREATMEPRETKPLTL